MPHRFIKTVAILLSMAAACVGASPARAAPRLLCLVRLADVPGLARDELEPALLLEQRKSGNPWTFAEARQPSECPLTTGLLVLLGPPASVEVRAVGGGSPGVGGAGPRFDLSGLDPLDRSAEAARFVVSGLGSPSATLVEAKVARLAWAFDVPPGLALQAGGLVRLGGVWAWESGPEVHGAEVDLEAGASLFDERLQIGVRTGWAPPRSALINAGVRRVQAVPVVVAVRGGLRLGRVRLLAGLAGGIEWRRLEFQPATRFGGLSRDSMAGLLEGSIEGTVAAWGPLRFALAGVFRGYFGGPSFVRDDRTVWEAPVWSAGLALRVGAVIPARSVRPAPSEGR